MSITQKLGKHITLYFFINTLFGINSIQCIERIFVKPPKELYLPYDYEEINLTKKDDSFHLSLKDKKLLRKTRAITEVNEAVESCRSENICKNRALQIPDDYNFFEIPFLQALQKETLPMNVSLKVRVEGIREIDESRQELTLDLELTLGWTDWKILEFRKKFTHEEMLNYLKNNFHEDHPEKLVKLNNPAYLEAIWTPNLFIYDLIEKTQPKLMTNLATLQYDPDGGLIFYLQRVVLKMKFPMEFKYYPTDIYKFKFKIRGFSYNENLLNLEWYNPPFLADRHQSNFEVQLSSYHKTKVDYEDRTFVQLTFTLMFRRKLSYHVVQTFIPSYIFVTITWLSFLIPPQMVEVRVGICMTILLTLTSMQVRAGGSQSSYVKALDIFMVTCIFSVFLLLLQFAVLTWLLQLKKGYHNQAEELSKIMSEQGVKPTKESFSKDMEWEKSQGKEFGYRTRSSIHIHETRRVLQDTAIKMESLIQKTQYINKAVWAIEKFAFVIFFVIFVTFNGVYWSWLIKSSGFFNWPDVNATMNAAENLEDS